MGRKIIDRILLELDLPSEVPPGWPLVELFGNRRVLIENQNGVCCYDQRKITVKVRQGLIVISGEELELREVTKNQLVVTGIIFGVSLEDWR